jgi:S1-C subfamily serine protease
MLWNAVATARLRNALAELYPTQADARRIVTDVEFPTSRIAFHPASINTWFEILEYARFANALDRVLDRALQDWPDNDVLRALNAGIVPGSVEGPNPSGWHGPSGARLEAIMGSENTLVPITYLEMGLERARSVARIRFSDGSSGTGFLTQDNVLVTNNHVIKDSISAHRATAQFNYQQTMAGLAASVDEYQTSPERFFATSVEHDWTAVALDGDPSSRWGSIPLKPVKVAVGDRVNIIQHPAGGFKQIAFYSNVVMYAGSDRVQYLTDTLPGSSGSPVFDRDWKVVAVHHSGGWHHEPGTQTKQPYWRNEGIAIDRILDGIEAAMK